VTDLYPPVEEIVGQCGKFRLLERLLVRLFANNHKVCFTNPWLVAHFPLRTSLIHLLMTRSLSSPNGRNFWTLWITTSVRRGLRFAESMAVWSWMKGEDRFHLCLCCFCVAFKQYSDQIL